MWRPADWRSASIAFILGTQSRTHVEVLNGHPLDIRAIVPNGDGILILQRFPHPFFPGKAEIKTHLELVNEYRAGTILLHGIDELVVKPRYDGGDKDHRCSTDQYAEDGKERTGICGCGACPAPAEGFHGCFGVASPRLTFRPQGFNGIEPGGLAGRINTEEKPHDYR